ncbi:MAG TPA: methyltransferase [Gemmataceae bacterium]|nr:methyltransferase [Gemmataceae bacterium]
MQETIPGCSLRTDDPDRIRRIRDVLDRAGYGEARVQELLGHAAPTGARPLLTRDRPLLLRRSAADPILGVLARLFLLRASVDLDAARRAIAPTDLEDWEAVGLLGRDGAGVSALAAVLPAASLRIALSYGDRDAAFRGGDNDVVMSPQSATTRLTDQYLIRRPVEAALDVCTGCGALGLYCSGHARRVVVADYSPAAVRTAAFNGLLNDLPDFQSRQGDFFAPVDGETFDQIVCNPPFVISPRQPGDADYMVYRDAGRPADAVSEHVVRSLPRFLRPGGFAQSLINWVHVRGEDTPERLRAWTAGSGCDAWIYRINTLDAADYVAVWIHPPKDYSDKYIAPFEHWVSYFERERIEAISYGLITLRARPAGRNWFVCTPPPRVEGPCGDDLAAFFERRTLVESSDDQALLGLRLRVGPSVRWRQEWRRERDDRVDGSVLIERPQGLAHILSLDGNAWEVVNRLTGERPLGAVLAELAEGWGEPLSAVIPACLRLVHVLLQNGFVDGMSEGAASP